MPLSDISKLPPRSIVGEDGRLYGNPEFDEAIRRIFGPLKDPEKMILYGGRTKNGCLKFKWKEKEEPAKALPEPRYSELGNKNGASASYSRRFNRGGSLS